MKTDFAAEETLLLAVMMTEGGDEGKRRRLDVGGEEWEDLCREKGGWEFIDGGVVEGGKNEFGGMSFFLYSCGWETMGSTTGKGKGRIRELPIGFTAISCETCQILFFPLPLPLPLCLFRPLTLPSPHPIPTLISPP